MSRGFGWKNLRNILHEHFGIPGVAQCSDVTIPAGTYYVPSGDVWGVLALVVETGAELRIDGEIHAWGDVTGPGIITGEGDLRLH